MRVGGRPQFVIAAGIILINSDSNIPLYSFSGPTSSYLYATSIGLDRPAKDILLAIRASLDPNGNVLTWGGLNPCLPYAGQDTTQLAAGQAWNGVTCKDSYSASAPNGEGGVSSIGLSYPSVNATAPLMGTLPLALRELRTSVTIFLGGHQLSGSLPPCWGQSYSRTYFPPGPGFDELLLLGLAGNALSGSFPAAFGAGLPGGAQLQLANNALFGTLPASLSNKSVSLAGNAQLFGTVPINCTVLANLGVQTANRLNGTLNGTAIGLADTLPDILLSIAAGLDPSGAVLSAASGWAQVGTNPCTWTGVVCTDSGGVVELLLDSAGLNGTVPCSLLLLTGLKTLWLQDNLLTGTIPDLSALAGLTSLRLNSNQLSGSIPAGFGAVARNLTVFANPSLCGTVPTGVVLVANNTARTSLGITCPAGSAAQSACNVTVQTFQAVPPTCASVVLPSPAPPPPPMLAATCGLPAFTNSTSVASCSASFAAAPSPPPPLGAAAVAAAPPPPLPAAPPSQTVVSQGLLAWYRASSYATTNPLQWDDLSGNALHGYVIQGPYPVVVRGETGNGSLAADGVSYVAGQIGTQARNYLLSLRFC